MRLHNFVSSHPVLRYPTKSNVSGNWKGQVVTDKSPKIPLQEKQFLPFVNPPSRGILTLAGQGNKKGRLLNQNTHVFLGRRCSRMGYQIN